MEMQIFGPHLRPTKAESLEVRPQNLCLRKPSRGFWCMLGFETPKTLWESASWYENFYLEIIVKIKAHWLACRFIKYISVSQVLHEYCFQMYMTFYVFDGIMFCSFPYLLPCPTPALSLLLGMLQVNLIAILCHLLTSLEHILYFINWLIESRLNGLLDFLKIQF